MGSDANDRFTWSANLRPYPLTHSGHPSSAPPPRATFNQGRATRRTSSIPRAPAAPSRWPEPSHEPSDDAGSAAARSDAPAQDSAALRHDPRPSRSHEPDQYNDDPGGPQAPMAPDVPFAIAARPRRRPPVQRQPPPRAERHSTGQTPARSHYDLRPCDQRPGGPHQRATTPLARSLARASSRHVLPGSLTADELTRTPTTPARSSRTSRCQGPPGPAPSVPAPERRPRPP